MVKSSRMVLALIQAVTFPAFGLYRDFQRSLAPLLAGKQSCKLNRNSIVPRTLLRKIDKLEE